MINSVEYYGNFRERCFSSFPTLETKRFLLLKYTKNYQKDIEELFSDEEVMKYSGTDILDPKIQAEIYLKKIEKNYNNKTGVRWVILDKLTYKFIGDIGLYNIDFYSNKSEIGYTIVKKYWRQKVATECIERILRFAFKELCMNKIIAIIEKNNKASSQLVKSLGFIEEGVLLEHYFSYKRNQYINVGVWSMIKKRTKFNPMFCSL